MLCQSHNGSWIKPTGSLSVGLSCKEGCFTWVFVSKHVLAKHSHGAVFLDVFLAQLELGGFQWFSLSMSVCVHMCAHVCTCVQSMFMPFLFSDHPVPTCAQATWDRHWPFSQSLGPLIQNSEVYRSQAGFEVWLCHFLVLWPEASFVSLHSTEVRWFTPDKALGIACGRRESTSCHFCLSML